ncbi:hypothetical protein BMS3Bbin15_01167 [archaeon BMS3Bbin15]|nr:hypothetical protein BMS3Bbin15_01167 [archaeon BMS3Bbin15]
MNIVIVADSCNVYSEGIHIEKLKIKNSCLEEPAHEYSGLDINIKPNQAG